MKWIIVEGYPNYEVGSNGLIRNSKTKKILKQHINKGYLEVFLYNQSGRRCFSVHRLVAAAFIKNPNSLQQVNHKDENPKNNSVENLEWCSPKYNSNYGTHKEKLKILGLTNNPFKGKKHSESSKLKMSLAKKGRESKRKRKIVIKGVEYRSITNAMKELNISTRKIYQIIKGETNYV